MNIYYQWEPGSYSHLASQKIAQSLNCSIDDTVGEVDFDTVWNQVTKGGIWVLPIENSYAWSIHHNIYNFLSFDHKIIGEYNFEVEHCLLSLETEISKVTQAYSHHQALSQTHKYLTEKNIHPVPYADTAWAAKMIAETQKYGVAAVASKLAAELYGLNILDSSIQDQQWNTTKFLVLVPQDEKSIEYNKPKGRITLMFSINHTPGSLYHCLWVFAQRDINITKIESIPMKIGHFSYAFWMTFEGEMSSSIVQDSLKELYSYAENIRILGQY